MIHRLSPKHKEHVWSQSHTQACQATRNHVIFGYLWGLRVPEASFTLNMQTYVTLLAAESMLPTALGGRFMEKAMAPHSSTPVWKNPMDGGAWWATVHGVAKSRTQLSDFTFTFLGRT